MIIRALGSQDRVEPDLSDLVAESGDTLLLTTDGLTRHVPDEAILEIVVHASCKEACARLIDAAKQGEGQDNIPCLIVRFAEKSWLGKLFHEGPGEKSAKWKDSL